MVNGVWKICNLVYLIFRWAPPPYVALSVRVCVHVCVRKNIFENISEQISKNIN